MNDSNQDSVIIQPVLETARPDTVHARMFAEDIQRAEPRLFPEGYAPDLAVPSVETIAAYLAVDMNFNPRIGLHHTLFTSRSPCE